MRPLRMANSPTHFSCVWRGFRTADIEWFVVYLVGVMASPNCRRGSKVLQWNSFFRQNLTWTTCFTPLFLVVSRLPTNSDFLPATLRDALIPSFLGHLISQICMIDFSSVLTFDFSDLPSDLLSYRLSDYFLVYFFRILQCLSYIVPLVFVKISCNGDWFVKSKYDDVYVTIFIFTNKDAYNRLVT